jgi:hypothetical protein
MPRHHDPVLVRHARIEGAALGIQDAIHLAPADVLQRHRDELPRMWAAIEGYEKH